jgi:hypothetical protein
MNVRTKINTYTGWETKKYCLTIKYMMKEYSCHMEHGINVCLPHSRTHQYKETLYQRFMLNYSNAAGELTFIAGLQEIVIVIAAETLFPGYRSRTNDLSDLASTVA